MPKTIVFIDGIRTISSAEQFLCNALVRLSADAPPEDRYTHVQGRISYYVHNVVQTFTSVTPLWDKTARYNEFKSSSSKIRIILATTSLGIGVNVPDIEVVVCWKFPIRMDPSDIWQRLGRGSRGPGCRSVGILLLPYWAFDRIGRDPTVAGSPTPANALAKR